MNRSLCHHRARDRSGKPAEGFVPGLVADLQRIARPALYFGGGALTLTFFLRSKNYRTLATMASACLVRFSMAA